MSKKDETMARVENAEEKEGCCLAGWLADLAGWMAGWSTADLVRCLSMGAYDRQVQKSMWS